MKKKEIKIPKFGFMGVCISKTKDNLKYKNKINCKKMNEDDLQLLKKENEQLKKENELLKKKTE